jgi:hypothetical protein
MPKKIILDKCVKVVITQMNWVFMVTPSKVGQYGVKFLKKVLPGFPYILRYKDSWNERLP